MIVRLRHPIDARLGVVAWLRDVARLGAVVYLEADELRGDAFRLEAYSATGKFTHSFIRCFSTRCQPLRNSFA